MLKRKIVAFQTGRAPGVHTVEPILTAARGRGEALHRLGVACESGEKTRPRSSLSNFPLGSFTNSRTKAKKLLRHLLLLLQQCDMMQKGEVIKVAQKENPKSQSAERKVCS